VWLDQLAWAKASWRAGHARFVTQWRRSCRHCHGERLAVLLADFHLRCRGRLGNE
jgi:hypothetical protein